MAATKTTKSKTWRAIGPNWDVAVLSSSAIDALEAATRAVENIWSESVFSSEFSLSEDPPRIGLLITMALPQSGQEPILVPSPIALANAGFHRESAEMLARWADAPLEDKLSAALVEASRKAPDEK